MHRSLHVPYTKLSVCAGLSSALRYEARTSPLQRKYNNKQIPIMSVCIQWRVTKKIKNPDSRVDYTRECLGTVSHYAYR